jgi:RimJ/RimL family protein N-acetyltransferase
MVLYDLKNGKKLYIRKATQRDAKELVNVSSMVGGESDNLSFGIGEFYFNEDQEKQFIGNIIDRENCSYLVAVVNDKIIGSLTFISSPRKRLMHRGDLGIAVLKDFWGEGVGSFLMDHFFRWVNQNGITKKIELQVREDNIRAINLYLKYVFKIEGRITRGMYVEGRYYDLYTMGKTIGQVIR